MFNFRRMFTEGKEWFSIFPFHILVFNTCKLDENVWNFINFGWIEKGCQFLENVSNRNNEFLCSLWDEPMQSELNETLPKWREIKI